MSTRDLDRAGPRSVGVWVVAFDQDVLDADLVNALDAMDIVKKASRNMIAKLLPHVKVLEVHC